jgi:N-carbamoyl-L-amino-acid hydrolase
MDDGLQEHIARAAERHAPGAWMRMASAAGHDAQVIATRLPCCMLFVPSIMGISHDFAEDTSEDDIVLGCRVAATAALSILRGGLGQARA